MKYFIKQVVSLVCMALIVGTAQASSNSWNVAGSGNWDASTANWIGDSTTFTNDGSVDVYFTNAAGGTITIITNMTPKSTTVSASSGTYVFSGGPIDGTGSLTKSGAGALTLSSSNSYNGGIILNSGTLTLSNGMAIGTGTLTINGGTLVIASSPLVNNNPIMATGSFSLSGGGNPNTGTGTFKLTKPITISGGGDNADTKNLGLTIPNVITDASGGNTLNAFDIYWNIGGTTAAFTLSGAITLRSNQTITVNIPANTSGMNISGNIGDGGNGYGLTLAGTMGTYSLGGRGAALFLRGTNTYSGDTLINVGTLSIKNNLALENSAIDTSGAGAVSLSVTAPTFGGLKGNKDLTALITSGFSNSVTTLTLNPLEGHTNNYSGVIIDGAAGMKLIKTGAGAQILSGTNSYTGVTIVSNGTLLVNGSITGVVTVATNASFGGTGTVNGNVILSAGAKAVFTPGFPLTITGSLALGNNVTAHLKLPDGLQVGTYPLVTFNSSGSSGSFAQIPVIDSGAAFGTPKIVNGSNKVDLVVSGLGTVITIR